MDIVHPSSLEEDLANLDPEDLRYLSQLIAEDLPTVFSEEYVERLKTKYGSEEREKLYKHFQYKIFFRFQIKIRNLAGWAEVHEMIKCAPKCRHEGKIMIRRYCPICKKIEHINGCNVCTTMEDRQEGTYKRNYHPSWVNYVKRLCKACKIRKFQNETSAAA